MEFADMAQTARREQEGQRERLTEKMEQLNDYIKLLDCIDELIAENRKQSDEIGVLQQQLAEEEMRRAEVQMKLDERIKLSESMVKKMSEEVFVTMLRPYVTYSKRKKAEKRAYAKTVILELANINGLILPEDLSTAIESLDDEQPEPKTVTVNGSYNDIHDNGDVHLNRK